MTTATLPRGWRERLVVIDTDASAPGRGYCLEPHDCVISKLVAGREKDYAFAGALVAEGLVSLETLRDRLALLDDVQELAIGRIRQWLSAMNTS